MSNELFLAITEGDVDTVRRMVDEDPSLASARDGSGLPAVLLALFNQQQEAADALLSADPELGVLEAAAVGRADRVRELVEADEAALEERTPEGFSPLGLAAFFGRPEVVRYLLEAGVDADDDAENQFGVRPVNAAAAAHDHESMKLLLEAGADPDAQQKGGFTPLHEAAHTDDVEMARLLLDAGADASIEADDGRDSATLAADDGSSQVAELLSSR
jgi:ankyrin repeat protein